MIKFFVFTIMNCRARARPNYHVYTVWSMTCLNEYLVSRQPTALYRCFASNKMNLKTDTGSLIYTAYIKSNKFLCYTTHVFDRTVVTTVTTYSTYVISSGIVYGFSRFYETIDSMQIFVIHFFLILFFSDACTLHAHHSTLVTIKLLFTN